MAESTIGLDKTEIVHREGPWRGVDDLEYATLDWVHSFDNRWLRSAIAYQPPIGYEEQYSRQINPQQQTPLGELAVH